jgi:hypothetical protein
MAHPQHTPSLPDLEEVVTVLFCLIDDAYRLLNPHVRRYESLKRLSDSEVISLALLQQLRGVESERSFLRDAQRFFSELFPGVVGLHPSSLHRRVRKLRRFLEPLRREVVRQLVGDPETLVVDSTLLWVLHPRQVKQSAGFEGAGGDSSSEPQARVPPRGDIGNHPLVGLLTRIAAKVTAYTYGFFVNRLLGRPQGRIKELWA